MLKKNIMGIRSSVILNRFKSNYLVMESITKEQEEEIDLSGELYDEMFFIKDNKYRIHARDIFLYGEININNKEDLMLINKSDIITQEVNIAANIPSNFDYNTGDVYSNNEDIFKTHDTWNKIDWFKFNYCLIGKPERIIIYRINKIYVPKDRSTRRNINISEL